MFSTERAEEAWAISSHASPTVPIDGRTPASLQRLPKKRRVLAAGRRRAAVVPVNSCSASRTTSVRRLVDIAQPTTAGLRVRVEHDGEVEESRPRRHVGDVGDPELVGSRCAVSPACRGCPRDELPGSRTVVNRRLAAKLRRVRRRASAARLASCRRARRLRRARRGDEARRTCRATHRARPRAVRTTRGPPWRASRAAGRPRRRSRSSRLREGDTWFGRNARPGASSRTGTLRRRPIRFLDGPGRECFRISRSSRSTLFS